MTTNTIPTRTLRGGDLQQLVAVLEDQHVARADAVLRADQLRFAHGRLVLENLGVTMSDDGVTDQDALMAGHYRLTESVVPQIGAKLGIPGEYLRKCLTSNTPVFDANVNGWLQHSANDERTFLVRTLQGQLPDGDERGYMRALLSDRYGFRDNLDAVMAIVQGLDQAGLDGHNIKRCELSDTALYLWVSAPEVAVAAPEIMRGYVSPFSGRLGADNPLIDAGFLFRNSETGHAQTMMVPKLVVEICGNGLQVDFESIKKRHLGAALEKGAIKWSEATLKHADELLISQVRDAAKQFLTESFLEMVVEQVTGLAETPLNDPMKAIGYVGKQLRYSKEEQDGILANFLRCGVTDRAAGVMHAITAFSQSTDVSVDRAYDLDRQAMKAMELAVATN